MPDNFYDYVILGTGLQECIASSELSSKGCSVLQIDREKNYGSDIRSLKYSDLIELTHKTPVQSLLDLDRSFNIDLTPKLLLASGEMTQYLSDKEMDSLVDFEKVGGNFICQDGHLHFIPKDEKSSLGSKLIGWLQKPYAAKFFWKVRKYSEERMKKGKDEIKASMSFKETMLEEFKGFSLNDKTRSIIGHAIALNLNEDYLDEHPVETYEKIFVYIKSLVALNSTSPFIYPLYGLSELSQAFSRRAGMMGCVFMLNTPVLQIEDNKGKILESEGQNFTAEEASLPPKFRFKLLIRDNINDCYRFIFTNNIISDSSYLPSHTYHSATIITSILILKSTCVLLPHTYRDSSAHIVFLAKDMNRKNDVFMALLGPKECVCPEGYSIAIVSTIRENDYDKVKLFGLINQKVGDIVDSFLIEREIRKGVIQNSHVIINDNLDQTTHFETLFTSIKKMLRTIKSSKDCRE